MTRRTSTCCGTGRGLRLARPAEPVDSRGTPGPQAGEQAAVSRPQLAGGSRPLPGEAGTPGSPREVFRVFRPRLPESALQRGGQRLAHGVNVCTANRDHRGMRALRHRLPNAKDVYWLPGSEWWIHPIGSPLHGRHVGGVQPQRRPETRRHRSAHPPVGSTGVEHDREGVEALPGGHAGDVGHPEFVGTRGREVSLHQFGRWPRICRPLRRLALPAQPPRSPPCPPGRARPVASGPQISVDPRGPVRHAAHGVYLENLLGERRVLTSPAPNGPRSRHA